MMTKSTSQPSFFPTPEVTAVSTLQSTCRRRISLTLSQWDWLDLLADDWWPLKNADKVVILGINKALRPESTDDTIAVIAWIEPEELPDVVISVWRNETWSEIRPNDLLDSDSQLIWPGPIPLSAVSQFTVKSVTDNIKLLALSKSFSNVPAPGVSVEVQDYPFEPRVSALPRKNRRRPRPPTDWNAIRGAAAMAAWAIPGITPWIKLFCSSLTEKYSESLAADVRAPWLSRLPWQPYGDSTKSSSTSHLWHAILATFQQARVREQWQPVELLKDIRNRVEIMGGNTPDTQDLYDDTVEILQDKRRVNFQRGVDDPLGLALQLVLLRPVPEKFVSWNEELSSSRPVVWWIGAILSGLLQGFRDLDAKFKGTPQTRHVLALRTWHLMDEDNSSSWETNAEHNVDWKLTEGKFRFLYGGSVWAERNESARGKWFEANLQDATVRVAALQLAGSQAPNLLRSSIRLADTNVSLKGEGAVKLSDDERSLSINGSISFVFPSDIAVETDLVSDESFRIWVATGRTLDRIAPPPEPKSRVVQPRKSTSQNISASEKINVPGLMLRDDFLSEDEESKLVGTIDALPWLSDLKRRVQHYGWRYNYKARSVEANSYIGLLPEWAERLGNRLFENRLVEERPDQVIVNEYVGKQGISKHIDCLPCFRGSIVTISLCEAWEMNFLGPSNEKVTVLLNRRSAAIMSGECRTRWKHEIPARQSEPFGNRSRRVSLTFRKVNSDQHL
jgi:alkylated DNA repair dioxygenase AlkB